MGFIICQNSIGYRVPRILVFLYAFDADKRNRLNMAKILISFKNYIFVLLGTIKHAISSQSWSRVKWPLKTVGCLIKAILH